MKLIFENWRTTLSEGVLEKETTEISRVIVNKIKKLVTAGTMHQSPAPYHWIDIMQGELPETLQDEALLHSLQVKVVKVDQAKRAIPHGRRARGNPVRMSGTFKGGKYRELTIYMQVFMDLAKTPEEFIQSISGWLPELKNMLRHELEHARQKTKDDKGTGKFKATGIGMSGTRKEAVEYFQTSEEKEAYVAGLYKKAKMLKKPFAEVFNDWLRTIRFQVMISKKGEEEFPDSEVQKGFDQIKKDYIEYAKQRFPAAQGIQEGWRKYLNEVIELDIEIGDIVLGGKFKNKRTVVKSIGKDDLGQPTINGKSMLKFRIEKQLPDHKKSKKTKELEKEEEKEE